MLALAALMCAATPTFTPAFANEKKSDAPESLSVPINHLNLPLMLEDHTIVGRLDLAIQIDATNADAVLRIQDQLPRIRDLLLTKLRPTPTPGSANLSAEALTEMKTNILRLLQQALGNDAIHAVYIVKAITRPG